MGLEWKSEDVLLLIPSLFTDPVDTWQGVYLLLESISKTKWASL